MLLSENYNSRNNMSAYLYIWQVYCQKQFTFITIHAQLHVNYFIAHKVPSIPRIDATCNKHMKMNKYGHTFDIFIFLEATPFNQYSMHAHIQLK